VMRVVFPPLPPQSKPVVIFQDQTRGRRPKRCAQYHSRAVMYPLLYVVATAIRGSRHGMEPLKNSLSKWRSKKIKNAANAEETPQQISSLSAELA